ncbi:alpha-amylase family glycosyl hydrolase [Parvularcula maris]|uniref:Alpha-amylase family glycosyl hydrolase n=1 Tax=Parvularcula maris TaxID=2965077 RepID=A0A9X2L6P8_9PROT|nr:alpha-amylase family glycosyl hydrolase [Parvularcula maris]MCQ8183988.1 alpha-amylase family glycosyl hydrolase [Parvularcula maris]
MIKPLLTAVLLAAAALSSALAQQQPSFDRPAEEDVIYFLLPDRFENGDESNDLGGIEGGRLDHGFDPTHKGFYHGGDLQGLISRLDYLEELGVNAIWLGPIYQNKAVQGGPGQESAGYHGYWITDFTRVDRHFGSNDDMKAFVDAAHARGMKVILDIITNHTADVIAYRECHDEEAEDYTGGPCPYRYEADYPYITRGEATGRRINQGFLGTGVGTEENFTKLTRPDWAYTPYLPEGEEQLKRPAWLNNPIYYHNRGDFTTEGETFLGGDFFGLDDLMTEHPRVRQGMVDIFADWIETYGIDGFRVDTARHVEPAFWRAFIPAMREKAREAGRPNFVIFGEVFDPDPAALARHTWDDGFPTVLDFAFQDAARRVIAEGEPSFELTKLFRADTNYKGGRAGARRLPTFLGNHDMGRFSQFVRDANPDASQDEITQRTLLGHVLLMTARGVPTLYYGDEQGFISDEGDQGAREDMFESRTDIYNDNDLLGTDSTTAEDNFDTGHPLYQELQELIALRKGQLALKTGAQITRFDETEGGLFAFSRLASDGTEILVVINAEEEAREENILTEAYSNRWQSLRGTCPETSTVPGSTRVSVPPLSAVVCLSQ